LLDRWDTWPIRSRLEPIKDAAQSMTQHRDDRLAWFDSNIGPPERD
jgi:hypothetical protein